MCGYCSIVIILWLHLFDKTCLLKITGAGAIVCMLYCSSVPSLASLTLCSLKTGGKLLLGAAIVDGETRRKVKCLQSLVSCAPKRILLLFMNS